MALFTVNQTLCEHDGACAAECPVKIIALDARTKLPVPIDGAEKSCINCGHCVAVCPRGALSLTAMPSADCRVLPDNWRLSPEQTEFFFKGRRSIRTFQEKPVDRTALEKIIDTARYAPTGINRQNVQWMVLYDAAKVHGLAALVIGWMRGLIDAGSPMAAGYHMPALVTAWDKGIDLICRNAPHAILAYGLQDDPMAAGSCTIALAHLELAALPHGLGTCWAGYAQMALGAHPAAQEYINLPRRMKVFGAMLVGSPRYRYARVPLRKPSRITWS